MNIDLLKKSIALGEGLRLKPYRDSVGKLSIGYGRNLDDVGISEGEALYMLDADIARTAADMDRLLPWWAGEPPWKPIDEVRQRVLLEMAFNLGVGPDCKPPGHLMEFVSFLPAVQEGRYTDAAVLMLKTLWARQVGDRAVRLSKMMETGLDPTPTENA